MVQCWLLQVREVRWQHCTSILGSAKKYLVDIHATTADDRELRKPPMRPAVRTATSDFASTDPGFHSKLRRSFGFKPCVHTLAQSLS